MDSFQYTLSEDDPLGGSLGQSSSSSSSSSATAMGGGSAPGGPEMCPPEMGGEEVEELYTQLAQKERDLTLAAELGKALLEKNQDLTKKNEQLVEEYSTKIEVRV